MLARIIQYQGWRNPIVVSARSGFVIAGHGRLEAALLLGCVEGRGEELTFSTSSQPPEVFAKKAEIEAKEGKPMTWKEFQERFPEHMSQAGTSIFDPVLAELALRWVCPAGGRVVDPFAGGSVRELVSAKLGMHYTGIDLRPEQVEANERQAEKFGAVDGSARWITGDSRNLPRLIDGERAFDFMLSCPPYYDLEVYSKRPEDLSALDDYPAFLSAYREIIAHECALLAPDEFACWVVGDVRDKRGWLHGLTGDTVKAFEDAGMWLYGRLKISLRRQQIEAAKGGNVTMLIWLGKQLLGQADKQETKAEVSQKVVPMTLTSQDEEFLKKKTKLLISL